jgi:hypothetical protein
MSWQYALGGEADERGRSSCIEIDLMPFDGGTDLKFTHSGLASDASELSHAWGWTGSLDKLVRHVESVGISANLDLEN